MPSPIMFPKKRTFWGSVKSGAEKLHSAATSPQAKKLAKRVVEAGHSFADYTGTVAEKMDRFEKAEGYSFGESGSSRSSTSKKSPRKKTPSKKRKTSRKDIHIHIG